MEKTKHLLLSSLLSLALITILNGCVTALVAGATVATIDVLHDRRSVGKYVDDSAIELKAKERLISLNRQGAKADISATSLNGVVLLTGEMEDGQVKPMMIDEIRQVQGVVQVVDETIVAPKRTIGRRSSDTWITTKAKSSLVAKTGLTANRVKVVTSNAVVYLMGVVTEEEGLNASEVVRTIKGVTRVVKVFEYKQ